MTDKKAGFEKGELVTVKPHPMEDSMSGQQYLADWINPDNYLGVVIRVEETDTYVVWLKHPISKYEACHVKTTALERV